MSDEPKPAMRKGDFLKSDVSQWLGVLVSILKQAVAFTKWGVRIVAILGGPETGGLSIVLGFIAAELLDKAFDVAADWAVDKIARAFAKGPIPFIYEGSPNVFFNTFEAARGGADGDNTTLKQIMQGSEWVYVNKRPAARLDDRTRTSGFCVLRPGPDPDIFIGGPPTEFDNKPELGKEAQLLLNVAKNFDTLKDLPKKIANLGTQAKQLRNAYDMGGKVGTRALKLGRDARELGNSLWSTIP
jgi:uncharacterized Zn-binding protein involved in type VI secretion